jgi:hypothetical protein
VPPGTFVPEPARDYSISSTHHPGPGPRSSPRRRSHRKLRPYLRKYFNSFRDHSESVGNGRRPGEVESSCSSSAASSKAPRTRAVLSSSSTPSRNRQGSPHAGVSFRRQRRGLLPPRLSSCTRKDFQARGDPFPVGSRYPEGRGQGRRNMDAQPGWYRRRPSGGHTSHQEPPDPIRMGMDSS